MILFLRSFRADDDDLYPTAGSKLISLLFFLNKGGKSSYEEHLTKILARFGPVIALGRPGERVQPLGASRDYVPNSEWQEKILEYFAKARLIVALLDTTAALQWELEHIFTMKMLDKLVIVIPPPLIGRTDLSAINALRARLLFLPEIDNDVAGVTWQTNGAVQYIRASENDLPRNLKAIRLWMKSRRL